MANPIELFLRARHIPARRSRLPYIESAPRPALTKDERAAFAVFARELRADLDMDLDSRYRTLLKQVRTRIKNPGKLNDALYHPEKLLDSEARYPLYSSEIAELVRALGVQVSARTVDRLVEGGLVPKPATIGTGKLVRSAFFARHLVDVLFEQLFVEKPEVAVAQISVLRRDVPRAMWAFYCGLDGVQPDLVASLEPVTAEGPSQGRTIAYERTTVRRSERGLAPTGHR